VSPVPQRMTSEDHVCFVKMSKSIRVKYRRCSSKIGGRIDPLLNAQFQPSLSRSLYKVKSVMMVGVYAV